MHPYSSKRPPDDTIPDDTIPGGPRVGGVRLRPLQSGDLPRLTELLAGKGVERWWGKHTPEEVEKDFLGGAAVSFGIEIDGELSGAIQFSEENEPDYRHASIDLFVGDDFQGRGYGPEAIKLLASHLINSRGHHRITIDPAVENVRAIRSYEKVGFRPVGVMRQYERGPDGVWRDGLLMDLLASDLQAGL